MLFEPVIILCPARSGGSVVASMLGQHPSLYGLPELRLFHRTHVAGLLDEPPLGVPEWRHSGLLRALAQIHDGEQSALTVNRARSWLEKRRDWTTLAILDHIQAAVAPQAVVEKSPETVRTVEALQRALTAYPNARFVHLVRHPSAAIASMVAAWIGLEFWKVDAADAHSYCARHWLSQHRLIEDSLNEHQVKSIRLRAEEVTDSTSSALASFCSWGGLDTGSAALSAMRSPEKSLFSRQGPPGARAGLDPGFLASPMLRRLQVPPALEPPDRWDLSPALARDLLQLAAQFGYAEVCDADRGTIFQRPALS